MKDLSRDLFMKKEFKQLTKTLNLSVKPLSIKMKDLENEFLVKTIISKQQATTLKSKFEAACRPKLSNLALKSPSFKLKEL